MLREFEEGLVAALDPKTVPSVAYGVARGEETLLLGTAGTGATAQTPYALASVTKPMTATAVMILAERGLVNLDGPMPGFEAATVRQVLDHTAGLPLHYRFYYADEDGPRRPFAEVAARYAKAFTPPGERHQYSNLGYGMLDDLIARVSERPYEEFMAEEVFGPLGMVNASIGAPEGAATAYGPDGVAYPRYDTDHPGGSAAFASAEDLLAFGRFHLGASGPLSREAMQVPRAFGYALGWGVAERFGRRVVGHTGGMGGVRTILRLVPELDLVIAILVNGEGDLPWRAADDALAALDPVFREGREAHVPAPPPAPVPVPQGRWRGTVDGLPFATDTERGVAVLDGAESPIEGLALAGGRIVGTFDGELGEARPPYRLRLDLGVRGDRLDGAVLAITHRPESGGTKDRRLGDALAYEAELDRV